MRDPEFVQLRNRFFIGVLISVLFAIPVLIFLYKTYASSNVLVKIDRDDTFVILVTTDECDRCKEVGSILKENRVNYVKLNSYTNKDYEEIMRKLGIVNKREVFPILVYVADGEMKANLFSTNTDKMVTDFLDYHNLNNSK